MPYAWEKFEEIYDHNLAAAVIAVGKLGEACPSLAKGTVGLLVEALGSGREGVQISAAQALWDVTRLQRGLAF